MKKLAFLTTAFLLLSVSAAVAQDVRYDFDKEKDFSKYKTYKWVAIKGADKPDDLTSKKINSRPITRVGAMALAGAEDGMAVAECPRPMDRRPRFTSASSM